MLTLRKFEQAYDIVQKVVLPTDLIQSDYFSELTGNKVYLNDIPAFGFAAFEVLR